MRPLYTPRTMPKHLTIKVLGKKWVLEKRPFRIVSGSGFSSWEGVESKNYTLCWTNPQFEVRYHNSDRIEGWWHIQWKCCGMAACSRSGGGRDRTLERAIKSMEEEDLKPLHRLLGGTLK